MGDDVDVNVDEGAGGGLTMTARGSGLIGEELMKESNVD